MRWMLSFLLLCPSFALAGPQAGALGLTEDTRERVARHSARFVGKMAFDQQQARQLIPLLEEAARLHIDTLEVSERLMPEMVAELEALQEQVSVGKQPGQVTGGRAQRLNREARDLLQELDVGLIEIEERVTEVFDPEQRERIERFVRGRRASGSEPMDERLRELHALKRAKHPRPGPVGLLLLTPPAYELVSEIAGRPSDVLVEASVLWDEGSADLPVQRREELSTRVQELRDEISNWNLINGLHLSEEAIADIVAIPDGEPATMERELEQVLTSGQEEVVRDFKPCLIPPKSLGDPVRVGQANNPTGALRWLERARRAPRSFLDEVIDEGLAFEARHLGPLSPDQHEARRQKLREIALEAAAMDDFTFELDKAGLAERVQRQDRELALRIEIDDLARRDGLPTGLSKRILNDGFTDQLLERAELMATAEEVEVADLASGPQADNCDDTCAMENR